MTILLNKNTQINRNGWHRFQASSVLAPIRMEDAINAQIDYGYHPAGYGFYDFKTDVINGQFVATWKCASSCD